MTQETPVACVKMEPVFSEEQEDLIMSYLNSDYMSSTPCWSNSQNHVSTPPTPRPTPTHSLSPDSTPEAHFGTKNMGMSPMTTTDTIPRNLTISNSDAWTTYASTHSSNEYFRQHEFNFSSVQPNIFSCFPFTASHQPSPYIGSADTVMYPPTFVPHHLLSQQPTSPSSFSSYSSSDNEQPKKRRGRKKRDLSNYTSFNSNPSAPLKSGPPAAITPAPARQLATILPAYNPRNLSEYINKTTSTLISKNAHLNTNVVSSPQNQTSSIKTEIKSPQLPKVIDNKTLESQKAATIAKRQERLIKNRAAALLSRKRKREHLTALEDERKDLSTANQALQERVLELEKENLALKSNLKETSSSTVSHSFERSSSEIVSMVILCYFAFIVSFSSQPLPGLISTLEQNARLSFTLSERSSLPFRLEAHHQNQECSGDQQLEYLQESNTVFEKITPTQTSKHKSTSIKLQDGEGLTGLGRKKFRRLSLS